MEMRYALYLADPVFYDDPNRARNANPDFELAGLPVPAGWQRSAFDHWLVYLPEAVTIPLQGWKIHVASCLDNAEDVLRTVFDYCIPRNIGFKFVRSPKHLFFANAKYANRGASGKFIAIYPVDESQLEDVLDELGRLLDGQPGPYILSDLRWGPGPLFVRYGGFAQRWCVGPTGEQELAIERPDGVLIPDRREATFSVHDWMTLPGFLEPHLAARNGTTVTDMPYEIREALHFSNGGGIYVGYRAGSEERLVLKEARPNAALDYGHQDAVTRLRRERLILERLAGLEVVPQVRDYFTYGGHEFLVEEFIEGEQLNKELVGRYPLDLTGPDDPRIATYTAWALEILERVEAAVAAVHERGLVMGDLHISNVLVRPDGRVVLIDFEGASEASEGRAPVVAAPAFMPPAGLTGIDADRYALACLRLYMFMPLTELLQLGSAKASELAAAVAEVFPVPAEFLAETVGRIAGDPPPGERPASPAPSALLEPEAPSWPRARASMAAAILASATPDRDDRLFPGDPMQFVTGGLNLAHGAAGVLYALAATGCGRFPAHEDWLVDRALHARSTPRSGPSGFSFYDGLHGVAHVLDHLDRRAEALEVLDLCCRGLEGSLDELGLDLRGGLAGIGLNLGYFAAVTGERRLDEVAEEVVGIVAARLGDEEAVPTTSGGEHPWAGLMRGSSGPALLFIRRYEQTGEERLLDLAATALRQDLRRCVVRENGEMDVDEGWRSMPYLAEGSVGIGLVLDEYLVHREDERFREAAGKIRRAAEGYFYAQAGLFTGRAGMILYLSHLRHGDPGDERLSDAAAGHIRRLRWHALAFGGHLAFSGDQNLRLSMDLATGTAGVLLALGAALHDQAASLPFLHAGMTSVAPAEPVGAAR
jgi:serine/threonine protein kinase